jgi:hypothetical protein
MNYDSSTGLLVVLWRRVPFLTREGGPPQIRPESGQGERIFQLIMAHVFRNNPSTGSKQYHKEMNGFAEFRLLRNQSIHGISRHAGLLATQGWILAIPRSILILLRMHPGLAAH